MIYSRRSILFTSTNMLAAGVLEAQSEEWFQNHDLTNRWEGLFGENQGGLAWEVRSFVASIEDYSMELNSDLKIRYYVPDSTKAFVKAQVITHNPSYRMEPKPEKLQNTAGWRYFYGWKTKDVLLPKRIHSTALGILIRLGDDDEGNTNFAPAIVYASAGPNAIKSYRFDFFTAQAVKQFSFDVRSKGYKRTYLNPGVSARGYLAITLDAADIPRGPARVVLGEPLKMEWSFYHEPLS